MKEIIFPAKIVAWEGGQCVETLLKKKALQIGLDESETAAFTQNGSVILDFGIELNGGIRLLTYLANNVKIRIRFGESLTECCSETGGAQNATNDHSLRDFFVYLQNYSDMCFGQTGFRFVRLDFFGNVNVKSVVAVNSILKRKALYEYRGEDKLTEKIFRVAKRTIDLCASGEYVWDGIKRDRLVWIGDMHPEMIALTTLYGRQKIIERSLDFVKKQTPLPNWMNRFPTYSMWWLIIVADYCKLTEAKDFASKQIKYAKGLVGIMLDYVSEDGQINYPDYFVDWQTRGKTDEMCGVRAINIIAAKKSIELLSEFNESVAEANELLKRLLKKEISVESSKSVLGLKYFAVGLTEADKKKLLVGGAQGLSTFMGYYILCAIASFDRDKAVKIMKDYYGSMLDKGATTFWEDFDVSWNEGSCRIDGFPNSDEKDIHGDHGKHCYVGFRHSLCHGWSAGVIKFIADFCN